MDISTSEITPIKVCGNKADFSTIEITPKKLRGNDVDFWTLKITFKKVGGNEMDFSISKIISKKYAQLMWKFVEIWSSTCRRNINVESRSIRRGVHVGL